MDILGETKITEPLDLTDVRGFLSMAPADRSEDSTLLYLISTCRAQLEDWLPFFLAPRNIEYRGVGEKHIYLKGPVLAVSDLKYRDEDGDWLNIQPADYTLDNDILILPDEAVGRPIRFTASVGARLPQPVQTAMMMMVKNQYNERTADPLTDEVRRLIEPYCEVNI